MKRHLRTNTTRARFTACALALVSLTLAACGGSFPVPTDRLANAEAAARTAHELDAENEPQAALHLKLANEQIDKAKAAIKSEDNKSADLLLQRAAADAELAIQLAKGAKAKTEAQQAQDRAANVRGGK
jgi:hypothetical protein